MDCSWLLVIKLNPQKENVSHVSVVSLYCKIRKYVCLDEQSEGEHNFI